MFNDPKHQEFVQKRNATRPDPVRKATTSGSQVSLSGQIPSGQGPAVPRVQQQELPTSRASGTASTHSSDRFALERESTSSKRAVVGEGDSKGTGKAAVRKPGQPRDRSSTIEDDQ